MKYSGKSLEWVNPDGTKFIPHVIEPAVGINRLFFMVLSNAYCEEILEDGKSRLVLKLKPSLSPVKVAIFPLQKDDKLEQVSQSIYQNLKKQFHCEYDNSGNIGKMYRRQDEIGTPWCVVVDYESLTDKCVTVRDRDTMNQVRLSIEDLSAWLTKQLYE
jgi:glycyl-tRNA synthetase